MAVNKCICWECHNLSCLPQPNKVKAEDWMICPKLNARGTTVLRRKLEQDGPRACQFFKPKEGK